MDITEKTEELLQKPAYLIDIFPKTVPYREDGRYFKVERILSRGKAETHRRFIRLILKLYCYHDVDVLTDSRRIAAPDPEELKSLLVRFFGCGDLPAGDGSGGDAGDPPCGDGPGGDAGGLPCGDVPAGDGPDESVRGLLLYLPEQDALILPDREDLYMTVYAPHGELMELLAALAAAEGLFFYKAP